MKPQRLNDGDALKNSFEYNEMCLKEALRELENRVKGSYYQYEPSSDKTKDFHLCGKQIRILEGGNRSGKTTAAIHEITMLNLGEHPITKMEVPNYWWVVCSSFEKVTETGGMLQKFKEHIPMNRVKKIIEREGQYKIIYDNDSEVFFKSQEQRVDAFTSVKLHGALGDERIHDNDIRVQLRMRLVDKNGLLIFTIDKLEDDEFIYNLGLNSYAKVWKIKTRENKFIPSEFIDRVEKELDEIDREKVLNGNHLERNLLHIYPDAIWNESNFCEIEPHRFRVTLDGKLEGEETGEFRMFKDVVLGRKYILGVDTAEGVGRNSSAIQVLDEFGEQCAVWWSNSLPFSDLDKVAVAIARHYNTAVIAVEYKSFGFAVVMKLKEYYPNLYYENKKASLQIAGKFNLKFGISTERDNKKDMATSLSNNLTTGMIVVHCRYTKTQLGKFVVDGEGKLKGLKNRTDPDMKNNDDDLVMALMFANKVLSDYGYIRRKQKSAIQIVPDRLNLADIHKMKDVYIQDSMFRDDGWGGN
jgi:hypothetical protein